MSVHTFGSYPAKLLAIRNEISNMVHVEVNEVVYFGFLMKKLVFLVCQFQILVTVIR